ncbi:unnamed protein product [Allacma fusca]|uniref:DUF7869 domain-containing protein n=1 Tax=Allacma fusca TaxID=39272 RepID=A0A8J2P565_9HEXA|nr:unnamed protein product [Allacma fusca]
MDLIKLTRADIVKINHGKRRKLNIFNWKDKVNKAKKDKGEAYEVVRGPRRREVRPALTPPDGSSQCRCAANKKPGCHLDFGDYVRLYESFRKLDGNEQNSKIGSCMQIDRTDSSDRTYSSYKYFLQIGGIRIIQRLLDLHKQHAKTARQKLDDEIQEEQTISVTLDMQKVLFLPRLTCSSYYFKRKLSTFNLDIHLTGTTNATMYLWDETIAGHSSKDIISCLYHYIRSKFNPLKNREIRKFVLWSDRCVGQFNNAYVLLFLKFLVDLKYFTRVEQKFLVTGHSWMSCDRDFGNIELLYRKVLPVVPDDIADIITKARPTNPFSIAKMQQENFFNFNVLREYVNLPNSFQVTKYLWYKIDSSEPNKLLAKEFHESTHWTSFNFIQLRSGGLRNIARRLPKSYSGPILVSKEKAADLRDLMQYIHEPEKFEYYDTITKHIV